MSEHLDDLQLSRLIDGDLSLTSREACQSHLRECPSCAERHDQLIAVAASLRLQPPLKWTPIDTDAMLDRAQRRRRPLPLAAATVAAMTVLVVVIVAAAPLLAVVFAPVRVLLGLARALTHPAVMAPAVELLVVIVAIAVIAPLAAYPLAKWR